MKTVEVTYTLDSTNYMSLGAAKVNSIYNRSRIETYENVESARVEALSEKIISLVIRGKGYVKTINIEYVESYKVNDVTEQ